MGSGKERNPKKKRSKPLLGPKKQKKHKKQQLPHNNIQEDSNGTQVLSTNQVQSLNFFLDKFQSANRVQFSPLELDSLTDKCVVDLSGTVEQDVESLGEHMKAAFGPLWKEELCEKRLLEGKVDPGSPAVLVISTSALRSIQLLRGFRSMTKECHAVKLFSKHMKVDEQGNRVKELNRKLSVLASGVVFKVVSLLKDRVNIASGTPNRIKKLLDIEALWLSRLSVIILDVHPDVKGYSLLTLPQVRDEFWDLYKNYFHQRLLQGSLRLSLYGPLISNKEVKGKNKRPNE